MQDTIETAIDRTQILDVEKLWPNPLDCPDWPFETRTRRYEGPRGRRGAELRLERLSDILNRSGKVHAPKEHERDGAFERVFSRTGSAFSHLGLTNLSPLDRTTESQAQTIVEAAHVRGYLRKLDAQETKATADAERSEIAKAQTMLDRWLTMVADGGKELAALADAEARHKQRIEDEKAFDRCRQIRIDVRHSHHPAVQAAARLGFVAPEMPTFVSGG